MALWSCGARGREGGGSRPAVPLWTPEFAELEGRGRLGVAVLDTGDGSVVGHRLDERFAMCSTFKLVQAAMVLEHAASGRLRLDDLLELRSEDRVSHAPITGPWLDLVDAGSAAFLSYRELARAVQTTSDNPAANVLLRNLGGPHGWTAYCRRHGDAVTRLDRTEPSLNDVRGDDPRDTTTPRAMATLVGTLLGPSGLPPDARATLRQWMMETETGAKRLRAGLPAHWPAGDKTGTGGAAGQAPKVNDVAWIEPPGRAPLVVAAYFDVGVVLDGPRDEDQAVLADVGRLVAAHVDPTVTR